jgi:hypothetical protein
MRYWVKFICIFISIFLFAYEQFDWAFYILGLMILIELEEINGRLK